MAELIMQEEASTPATPATGKWKIYPKADGFYVIDDAGQETGPFSGPAGAIQTKYKFQVITSTNNLIFAIKYIDGSDPSAAKKLTFRVGDTEYALTAVLSFTKNAGTNWMNMGGAALAAKDVDLFVYAIGETGASAGLKFGYSRIPYANTMGDFVNATTNERYIAGNWTNFNASDPVTNIGRFRAQLSAGAGYAWSIPNVSVINYPIFETDVLDFTCTVTYTGGTTNPTSNTINTAKYYISGRDFRVHLRSSLVRGTGNRTVHEFTLPWAAWVEGTSPANALTSITVAGIASCTGYMSGATFVFYNVAMANDGTYYGTGVNTMS